MGRIPRTGAALATALALAAMCGTASAGTWASLTSPQPDWDQPFTLTYDGLGKLYASTFANAGPTSVFVRPVGGPFDAALDPVSGDGPTPLASDDSGRVTFLAGHGGDILYRRRGPMGKLAPDSPANLGTGVLPALSVNGDSGEILTAWPPAPAGGALTVKLGVFSGTFTADTLTGTPTAGTPLGLPFVFAALDGDNSGVVAYTDDNSADGDLSYIVRDPSATPLWGPVTPVAASSAITSAGMVSDSSGDAALLWSNASGNHAAFRPHDATSLSADDPPPSGTVASAAEQADGSTLAVIADAGDVTLYRHASGGSGWSPLSGPHAVNSLSASANAVVAASRKSDKIAFAWTQKPADDLTQAYRIFAQVGTAADLGPATALPGQPATPAQTSSPPNHNELPVIAVDPSGNAVAFWRGFRAATDPANGLVFAAIFAPTAPVDPGGGGGTPPPAGGGGTAPPGGGGGNNPPPAEDPVERLLGLNPHRTAPAGSGLGIPVFCVPANTNGCNGAIATVISGSYQPGGPVFAARKPRLRRFTYRLRAAKFVLRPGQRRTVRITYPRAVRTAIRTALRHRGGRVSATVQATLRGRRSKKFVVRLKR